MVAVIFFSGVAADELPMLYPPSYTYARTVIKLSESQAQKAQTWAGHHGEEGSRQKEGIEK